jgi:hypothetical protein
VDAGKSILVVDEDDGRRRALSQALAARGIRYLDVGDAFAAMAALGRADFAAVLAAEGRRTLSLRGLCQLARKRHPDIMILVLPKVGSDELAIRAVLEMHVDMLPSTLNPEQIANSIVTHIDASAEPTHAGIEFNPFEMPSTQDADSVFDSVPRVEVPRLSTKETSKVSRSPALVFDDVTRPDAKLSSSTQAADVVFDGHFEDVDGGAGAALLMGLFSQDLTGKLTVAEGEASGTLYLYRGEPVWADDPGGDAGIHRKLVQKKFLKPDDAVDAVAEGQLLGSLMQSGRLTGQQMHDFMREVVRDRVIGIASQTVGPYHFVEDKGFLDTAPLLKVNPFGLIIDSRRRRLPPPALMALGGEIEDLFVVPLPALKASGEKLRTFVRGADVTLCIDGKSRVKEFLGQIGLDLFMGSLVVVAMRDARLVSLEQQTRQQGMDLADNAFTAERSVELSIVDSETAETTSVEETKAREDIYTLYMRLKPLTQPRQVLGVPLDASVADVEAAYQQRMKELDPRRIPEGSAQAMLAQRVEELRRKVTSAYQALKVMSGINAADSDTNPF